MKLGFSEIKKLYLGTIELDKLYLGYSIVYSNGEAYVQKWSEDQPIEHNTPVPLDEIGLSTDFISISIENVFETVQISDNIGLSTGFISVTVQSV